MWVKIPEKQTYYPGVIIGTMKMTQILEKLKLCEMTLPSESLVQIKKNICDKYLVFVFGVKDHW
jgi:hypothetical protein